MQCNDCEKIYLADNEKQTCPYCGGKGTVLIDVTNEYFPSRKERRAAGYIHGKKLEKYLPCKCKQANLSLL